MKRLVSLALVLMLIIGCMPVSASELTDKLLEKGVSQEVIDNLATEVNVPTDILEKLSTASEYIDGPVYYTGADLTTTVDVKAVVDLAPVKTAFKAYIAAGKLAANGDADKLAVVNRTPLYGAFTITINIPEGAVIPEEYKTTKDLGFSCAGGDWADNIYKEAERRYTDGENGDTLEIVVEVVDPEDATKLYMTAQELDAKADFYFGTLEFTCPGIVVSGKGEHIFAGAFEGITSLGEKLAAIGYKAVQKDNGDIINAPLTAKVDINAGGHYVPPYSEGGETPSHKVVTVTFDPNGGTLNDDETITHRDSVTVKFDEVIPPSREGYEFTGWAYDRVGSTPAEGEVTVVEDTTFYAQWVNVKAPDQLNSEDHEAYVIGYPDGTVRPEANITRAEVTTIFYRLLKDEVRDSIFTTANNYPDVAADFWASKAISTMSNGKYIMGDDTGMFRPDDAITRAEFAAIATRFLSDTNVEGYESTFTDISGHWAENAIKLGASVGWIAGYDDGTFKPEQYITRAEAMTIINRVLVRYVDEAGLVDGYVKWPDNSAAQWYYYNVIEATNSHDYEREANKHLEKWTQITVYQVWVEKAEYEDPEA